MFEQLPWEIVQEIANKFRLGDSFNFYSTCTTYYKAGITYYKQQRYKVLRHLETINIPSIDFGVKLSNSDQDNEYRNCVQPTLKTIHVNGLPLNMLRTCPATMLHIANCFPNQLPCKCNYKEDNAFTWTPVQMILGEKIMCKKCRVNIDYRNVTSILLSLLEWKRKGQITWFPQFRTASAKHCLRIKMSY